MGTHSITYVILDGDFRLGQYKQLDGYPEGLGLDLLRFLAHTDRRLLKTKFDLCCPFYPSLEEVYCRHDEAELIGFKFDPKGSPNFSPVNHLERLFERGAGTIIHVPIDSFVEFDKDSHADIEFIYIVNLDTWRFELLDHHYGGLNIISSYDLDNLPDRRTFLQDYCQFIDTMNSGSHGSYSHYIYPEDREPFDKLMRKTARSKAA